MSEGTSFTEWSGEASAEVAPRRPEGDVKLPVMGWALQAEALHCQGREWWEDLNPSSSIEKKAHELREGFQAPSHAFILGILAKSFWLFQPWQSEWMARTCPRKTEAALTQCLHLEVSPDSFHCCWPTWPCSDRLCFWTPHQWDSAERVGVRSLTRVWISPTYECNLGQTI